MRRVEAPAMDMPAMAPGVKTVELGDDEGVAAETAGEEVDGEGLES
jgi:hypothetical protein